MDSETYGALVGWTHHSFDGRLIVGLQSTSAVQADESREIQTHYLMMTDQQALLLANYLSQISAQVLPSRRGRGWLMRLLSR